MTQSVADIVRQQAAVGIDIVSDGEIGKLSWISYLYERVSGLSVRALPPGSNVMPPSRDRQAFQCPRGWQPTPPPRLGKLT